MYIYEKGGMGLNDSTVTKLDPKLFRTLKLKRFNMFTEVRTITTSFHYPNAIKWQRLQWSLVGSGVRNYTLVC